METKEHPVLSEMAGRLALVPFEYVPVSINSWTTGPRSVMALKYKGLAYVPVMADQEEAAASGWKVVRASTGHELTAKGNPLRFQLEDFAATFLVRMTGLGFDWTGCQPVEVAELGPKVLEIYQGLKVLEGLVLKEAMVQVDAYRPHQDGHPTDGV